MRKRWRVFCLPEYGRNINSHIILVDICGNISAHILKIKKIKRLFVLSVFLLYLRIDFVGDLIELGHLQRSFLFEDIS